MKRTPTYKDIQRPGPERREDLSKLPDQAHVPPLEKYQMADLRQLIRDEASSQISWLKPSQVRPGSIPHRSVGIAALNFGEPISRLPRASESKDGDVVLFSPSSSVTWLMARTATVTNQIARWANLSAGTPLRYTHAGQLNFTTPATVNQRSPAWAPIVTLPWRGGYRFRFMTSIRQPDAVAHNVGYMCIGADPAGGLNQIGDEVWYGRAAQTDASATTIYTNTAFFSVVNFQVYIIQRNTLTNATFQMYSPELEVYVHYIET